MYNAIGILIREATQVVIISYRVDETHEHVVAIERHGVRYYTHKISEVLLVSSNFEVLDYLEEETFKIMHSIVDDILSRVDWSNYWGY